MKKNGGNPPKTERNNELKALHEKGMSLPKLAVKFGISQARVCQILYGYTHSKNFSKWDGLEDAKCLK